MTSCLWCCAVCVLFGHMRCIAPQPLCHQRHSSACLPCVLDILTRDGLGWCLIFWMRCAPVVLLEKSLQVDPGVKACRARDLVAEQLRVQHPHHVGVTPGHDGKRRGALAAPLRTTSRSVTCLHIQINRRGSALIPISNGVDKAFTIACFRGSAWVHKSMTTQPRKVQLQCFTDSNSVVYLSSPKRLTLSTNVKAPALIRVVHQGLTYS